MKKVIICAVFFLLTLLSGCGTRIGTTLGGTSALVIQDTQTVTTETVNPDTGKIESRTVTTTNNETSIQSNQPENPDEPSVIRYHRKPDGQLQIETNSGRARDVAGTIASIQSLDKLQYAGIFFIVIGIMIGLFSKGSQLLAAASFGAAGIGLIVLAFLLPTYSLYFMIGLSIALLGFFGYLGYTIWKYVNTKRAVQENVVAMEIVKEKLPEESREELFESNRAVVPAIQSDTTRNIVKRIRKNEFKRS